ncbi:hypothetical protein JCM15640A_25820 [Hoylesella timonensis 4401737 = DSM 22865 = JCM 15640]|uniref:hypothetical protein n=1 Tax=Hoylesella timonensis TaxID=386414 RepID=UPI0003F4B6AD|nr:hypothetical protein [Hoylesella timonensis]
MNNLLKGFIIVILSTLFTSCSSHQGIKSVTADGFENALYDRHVQLLNVRAAELGANAIVRIDIDYEILLSGKTQKSINIFPEAP